MISNQLLTRSCRPILDPRLGLFFALLVGLFIISGCGPEATTPLPATTGSVSEIEMPHFISQPIIDIAHIQPFELEQSFQYSWRREQPDARTGLLVVFEVDPEMVIPRNALEPVLYAGNQTVQRLNQGNESGFVIGIIPEQIDLSQEPIWFGAPALPERIDAEMIARERAIAEESGISGPISDDIEGRTQDPVTASDLTTLLREQAAELVLEFSPQEERLADSWRLPVTKP